MARSQPFGGWRLGWLEVPRDFRALGPLDKTVLIVSGSVFERVPPFCLATTPQKHLQPVCETECSVEAPSRADVTGTLAGYRRTTAGHRPSSTASPRASMTDVVLPSMTNTPGRRSRNKVISNCMEIDKCRLESSAACVNKRYAFLHVNRKKTTLIFTTPARTEHRSVINLMYA